MEIVHTNTCPQNYKFTGYERDPETADPNTGLNGLDYSFARYYSSSLGRFMSADPLAGAGDPQSLNRYAYVGNNTTNFTDPIGLFKHPCNPRNPAACFYQNWDMGGGLIGGGGWFIYGWGWYFSGSMDIGFLQGFVPVGIGSWLQDGGGDGGFDGGRKTARQALTDCVFDLYGVTLTSFTPTQPGVNGSFTGFGRDINQPDPLVNDISVTNNIQEYTLGQMNPGGVGEGLQRVTTGFTYPTRPYENYSASDTVDPALAATTQLVELGNSLALITGNTSVAQALEMDKAGSPPGQALKDCVNKETKP